MAEVALEPQAGVPGEGPGQVAGRSPWELGWRRLRRDRLALGALALFIVIVAISFAAPLYADHIAHTDPFDNNLNGTTIVDGKEVPIMQQGGGVLHLGVNPIGPTWDVHHYFLGADTQGRDVAARMLYGGRSSLLVGIGSAVLACFLATVLALIAGFYGGVVDALLSRLMDVIWAFPVVLLAIALGIVLAVGGLKIGPIHISGSSIWIPILVIGVVYTPYMARPIRGEILALREKEFIEAAVAQGASNRRLIFSEILPNVISVVIVLLPLMVATTIITEAALSFLGVGVQPPNASWGTIISDGNQLLYTRPWVAIAPGIMIVLTVLALNVLGDGIRDALDPRAKLRVGA